MAALLGMRGGAGGAMWCCVTLVGELAMGIALKAMEDDIVSLLVTGDEKLYPLSSSSFVIISKSLLLRKSRPDA